MTREEAIKRIKAQQALCCVGCMHPQELGYCENTCKLPEAYYMAIKALQGDMYCPNCGVRLVPENEYLEPTQTHGRLIDADMRKEKE